MSKTDEKIQVRAAGNRNAQVTDKVKDCVYSWLEDRGVSDARENVVLSHYREGNFVSVSNQGVSEVEAFNAAYSEAVDNYWRNQDRNDDCFWLSRYWIADNILTPEEQQDA